MNEKKIIFLPVIVIGIEIIFFPAFGTIDKNQKD